MKEKKFWVAVFIKFILVWPHFWVYFSKASCSLSFPLEQSGPLLIFFTSMEVHLFILILQFFFKSSLAILLVSQGLLTKLNCKFGGLMLQAGHVIILSKMRLHDLNYVPKALLEHSKWSIKCLYLLFTSMRDHLFLFHRCLTWTFKTQLEVWLFRYCRRQTSARLSSCSQNEDSERKFLIHS